MSWRQAAPWWSWALPALAWAALVLVPPDAAGGAGAAALLAVLVGSVFAAVHHAEVIAHRVGEPFGALVLAIAVTVIEVALIVSLMLASPDGKPTLARDTVFAAVIIVCNGIVGLCLLAGGARHHEQGFEVRGAASYLAVLITFATLTLVMPGFTTTAPGLLYSPSQMAFVSVASLALYAVFLFVQTVRHRDYFLPAAEQHDEEAHAAPPTTQQAGAAALLLLAALGAVVWLAKGLAPTLEAGVRALGAAQPAAIIGVVIAALVLLPESLAAVRAARLDRLQTSLNLALGSAMASIALTVPVVVAVSLWLGTPLVLGLGGKDMAFLALTLLVSTLTLGTGRTTVLQGAVHLVIMAAFVFLVVVP